MNVKNRPLKSQTVKVINKNSALFQEAVNNMIDFWLTRPNIEAVLSDMSKFMDENGNIPDEIFETHSKEIQDIIRNALESEFH